MRHIVGQLAKAGPNYLVTVRRFSQPPPHYVVNVCVSVEIVLACTHATLTPHNRIARTIGGHRSPGWLARDFPAHDVPNRCGAKKALVLPAIARPRFERSAFHLRPFEIAHVPNARTRS